MGPGQPRIRAGLAGKAAGLPRAAAAFMIGACRMNHRTRPALLDRPNTMIPTALSTTPTPTGR
jgi:hypothetical protein